MVLNMAVAALRRKKRSRIFSCVSVCDQIEEVRSHGGKPVALVSQVKNTRTGKIAVAFKTDEATANHKKAVEIMIVLPKACQDVGKLISSKRRKEKHDNREFLLKILSKLKVFVKESCCSARGRRRKRLKLYSAAQITS